MTNPLAQLPVRKIWARKIGGGYVAVLVDGDYDGEYFAQFKWVQVRAGYIVREAPEYVTNNKTGERRRAPGHQKYVYLHQEVLPLKKGYWVSHINGDKTDNRSANLKYMTPKENTQRRSDRMWEKHVNKFYKKIGAR